MPPKGYKKHCCACLSSAAKEAVYCCIGKARWCARHKRWYQRRNDLMSSIHELVAKLDAHAKTF